jgi:hypothetical protein
MPLTLKQIRLNLLILIIKIIAMLVWEYGSSLSNDNGKTQVVDVFVINRCYSFTWYDFSRTVKRMSII